MRLKALKFEGYEAGQTDFAAYLATAPADLRTELSELTAAVAAQLVAPHPDQFFSLIVIGHADRQDRADLGCDERRASETEAATGRAFSAWEWIKADVTSNATALGTDVGQWWEDSPFVTWGLASAGASQLKHNPPTQQQRRENRRVILLVSHFRGPVSAAVAGAAVPPPATTPQEPPSPPPPDWPGRDLKQPPDMSGEDVRLWQQRMRDLGFELEVDGVYGQASRGVCEAFQAGHGLDVDGIVGQQTWEASFG